MLGLPMRCPELKAIKIGHVCGRANSITVIMLQLQGINQGPNKWAITKEEYD